MTEKKQNAIVRTTIDLLETLKGWKVCYVETMQEYKWMCNGLYFRNDDELLAWANQVSVPDTIAA